MLHFFTFFIVHGVGMDFSSLKLDAISVAFVVALGGSKMISTSKELVFLLFII